jgi:hypothetical protein
VTGESLKYSTNTKHFKTTAVLFKRWVFGLNIGQRHAKKFTIIKMQAKNAI